MTREEIRNVARSRLGETISRSIQNVDMNIWFNRAGHDLAYKTKCKRTSALMTTTSDTAEYTISTAIADDVLSVTEVYLYMNGTTWKKLPATTRAELNLQDDGWKSTAAAVPQKYWYDIVMDIFGVYPKANSDNVGTNYVQVYYSQKFTEVTTDTTTPGLPVPLHMAMADYMVALGWESKGNDRNAIIKANTAWGLYGQKILGYLTESNREKEDEDVITRSYRNIR